MTPPPLRIGAVSYLNAKPLLEGIPPDSLLLLPPNELVTAFENHTLDVALLPSFYLLNHPQLRVVRGIGIGCEGTVFSVFIKSSTPCTHTFQSLQPCLESVTSNRLAEVILKKYHQSPFVWKTHSAEGEVVIGDRAFEFKSKHPTAPLLDLGDAWWNATGLPFAFALWIFHPSVDDEKIIEISSLLKNAWAQGKSKIHSYSKTPLEFQYLSQYLRYELTPAFEQGIDQWQNDLIEIGTLAQKTTWSWT